MTRGGHRQLVFAVVASVTVVGLLVGVALRTAGQRRPAPALEASVAGVAYGTEPLAYAMSTSVRLGPLPGSQSLRLTLALKTRQTARLDAMIASGRRVTSIHYDADYGPAPAAVQRAEDQLRAAGLTVDWPSGSAVLDVSGPAAAVERLLHVHLEQYAPKVGPQFYANQGPPRLVGALAHAVSSVVGLDDYSRSTNAGMVTEDSGDQFNGYSPTQIFDFYHFQPLFKAGLNGSGETVVFLELDTFRPTDLALFTSKYHITPFPPITVHTSPSFGSPSTSDPGEPDLDLDIVHAVAPDAKLVVYYANGAYADIAATYAAMAKTYPTAIVSDSIGGCEAGAGAFVRADNVSMRQLAATGGTLINAAGDSGAFTCQRTEAVSQWNPAKETPNVSTPADDPYVTAVGGTSIFPGVGDTYGREIAWGNPVEQAGGGGGLSAFFKRPSWQKGPGVQNQYSNGMRQVPDVGSVADTNTGWDIPINGVFQPVGGTSTGAPLWAGLAALTDQSLKEHHHKTVGFMDPALYYFGSHANSVPAPAFHDVTEGNNLYYPATVAWDYDTGLGTPNAANLVDDFLAYEPQS